VSEDRGQIERLKWFEALQTVSKSEMWWRTDSIAYRIRVGHIPCSPLHQNQ
jgi:hypothetical protein